MRMADVFIPTLKEVPAEAEVISHQLMLRAGMIRKLAAGIYAFLPLGRRVLNKVTEVIREEMDRSGAQEVLLPALLPAELWQESGRWYKYGKEMMRLKDRHDRDFCLGPTHEEVITDLVRREVRSYKDLPMNLYQIQMKFRDEPRPRFGLLRGREFIMKDSYSFHVDVADMEREYWKMFKTYERILRRIGVEFRPVQAPTGLIGGDVSHEFMILADSGEDHLIFCTSCNYAANREIALRAFEASESDAAQLEMNKKETVSKRSVEEVSSFLGVPAEQVVKTLVYKGASGKLFAFLVRGDRELSEDKAQKVVGEELAMIAQDDFKTLGISYGYVGPVDLKKAVPTVEIVADREVVLMRNATTGANEDDHHYINVNVDRDYTVDVVADISFARAGDKCHECGGALVERKGIEAGQVFQLGTKYSETMGANYLDENGKEQLIVMGCYGIGVSRIVAATIEQMNDENGIIWPTAIAPFEVAVLALNADNEDVLKAAREIYDALLAQGIEVVLDDRAATPGVKFSEADLIGTPYQIVVGKRGIEKGACEIKTRRTGEKIEVTLQEAAAAAAKKVIADKVIKE